MDDREAFAQWLVDNQDRRGTPEWDTVAEAFKKLDSATEVEDTRPQFEKVTGGVNDFVSNVGTGLWESVGGLVGMPQALGALERDVVAPAVGSAGEWISEGIGFDPLSPVASAVGAHGNLYAENLPSIEDAQEFIFSPMAGPRYDAEGELIFGGGLGVPRYEPETGTGRVIQDTAEGIGYGALTGGGPVVSALIGTGMFSGQVAEEAGAPPWVSQLLEIGIPGGGLLGGAVIRALRGTSPIAKVLQTGAVTEDDLVRAQALMADAQRRGTRLTWAEALGQVKGGGATGLRSIQRVVEQSPGGAGIMDDFMVQRTAGAPQAFATQADDIARMPEGMDLGTLPTRVMGAADDALARERTITNQLTKPHYNLSANNPAFSLSDDIFKTFADDDAFKAAVGAVRQQPAQYGSLSNMSDNSGPVLDAVIKYLKDQSRAVSSPFPGSLAGKIEQAMFQASPEYQRAVVTQSIRAREVERPLQQGTPLGALSATDDMAAQRQALMPPAPENLDPTIIRETIRRLTRESPEAVPQWVRANLESVFNRATKDAAAGGANQWGAAAFRNAVFSNAAQKRNLQALIQSMPDGPNIWKGFNRMLDVFEAQSMRFKPGSSTAFNTEIIEGLGLNIRDPNVIGAASRFVQGLAFQHNTRKLANLLTDQSQLARWKQLATQSAGSNAALKTTLAIIAEQQ
jgi:hypothetical protein